LLSSSQGWSFKGVNGGVKADFSHCASGALVSQSGCSDWFAQDATTKDKPIAVAAFAKDFGSKFPIMSPKLFLFSPRLA
jgi:hypothetical protein